MVLASLDRNEFTRLFGACLDDENALVFIRLLGCAVFVTASPVGGMVVILDLDLVAVVWMGESQVGHGLEAEKCQDDVEEDDEDGEAKEAEEEIALWARNCYTPPKLLRLDGCHAAPFLLPQTKQVPSIARFKAHI